MPKTHRGRRNRERVIQRIDRHWAEKGATSATVEVDQAPGQYARMKANGKELLRRLEIDYPAETRLLAQAPQTSRLNIMAPSLTRELKPGLTAVLRKFTDIIKPHAQAEIQHIFEEMQAAGICYPRPKHGSNQSETPALHLGIWEKFRMKPKITNESWKMQHTLLLPRAMGMTAENELGAEFEEMPWLDFKGAFFAIAIKEGGSEINHLDWSDNPKGLTWVAPVGTWRGGDLKTIEMGLQTSIGPGDAIIANMREIVHAAAPGLLAVSSQNTVFEIRLDGFRI
ncbi:hypothetical protein F5876DRAFT_71135 [Lentinula aff. lateritia]|uniref:Uncharacterized protein n=1 Tax=Lentinula aff. lateritia TaxID=2804960 RepID=A0ACC1TGR7_9AGAR|nr:hypothetical protein F5876DRAFT_71135 [Lentinula aff. lateritia]